MNVLGGEMTSILAVGGLSVGLTLAFPPESFKPLPSDVSAASSECVPVTAYVTLDEKTEVALLRLAKESWRKENGSGRLYADLVYAELPEDRPMPVLSVQGRARPPEPPIAESGISPFLPSQRAEAPRGLPKDVRADSLPFSREELLRID